MKYIITLFTILLSTGYSNLLFAQGSLCEQFEGSTFPPVGWAIAGQGAQYWLRSNQGGFGTGHSAEYDMWSAPAGTNAQLFTPVFLATNNGDSLVMDISYFPYPSTPPFNQDSLIILATTNGGITYVSAARLGPAELNTCNPGGGGCTQPIWVKRNYWLPAGTNAIQFIGKSQFGSSLYLDSVCILRNIIGITPISTSASSYSLEQNYPNPFNPSTNMRFSIPKAGFVKFIITDALGRIVKTPVNEFKSAGGYNVDFDAGELSSGIYFYTLSSGDWIATKKMLLLK